MPTVSQERLTPEELLARQALEGSASAGGASADLIRGVQAVGSTCPPEMAVAQSVAR